MLFGYSAGGAITEGVRNVAVGGSALSTVTTQGYNVAIGHGALLSAESGENVAVGFEAGRATTTTGANVYIGYQAGTANTTGLNIAIGQNALVSNNTGTGNIVIGTKAMDANVAGDESIAIGDQALTNMNPSGNVDMFNLAVGHSAGKACTVGVKNTILGNYALFTDDTGSGSVAVGYKALYAQNPSSATDMHNVAVGEESAVALTEGNRNTIVGQGTAGTLTTGNSNVIIGRSADVAAAGDDFSIVIGSGAQGLGSNTTLIGTTSTINAQIKGLRTKVTATTGDTTLTANDSGETFVFNDAAATFTLPDSGGGDLTGVYFHFIVLDDSAGTKRIQCADSTDEDLIGAVTTVDVDSSDATASFAVQVGDAFHQITFNGTTTGRGGSKVTVTNIAADKWHVEGTLLCSGTPATPFS